MREGNACYLCDPENPTLPTAATDDTRVRADLLRLLITGGSKDCGLHERGVTLIGGWIEGAFDLAYCTASGQTALHFCRFPEKPRLEQARFQLLSLYGSQLDQGLYAQGARIRGSLFLRHITAKGTVAVNSAQIGGQLDCGGAKLDGKGGDALNAQGVTVGQNLFIRSLRAKGTVDVNGAEIGGQLDCTDANFDSGADEEGSSHDAFNAQGATVGQSIFLRHLMARGTVNLNGAQVRRQLDCSHGQVDGKGRMALHAQGVAVDQDLSLRNLSAMGTVNLNGAQIGGQFSCTGATLRSKGGGALLAQRLRVAQGLFFRNPLAISGQIDLTAAHAGDLVDDPDCWPTSVDDLILDGFTYDRIDGPTTLDARRRWLHAGSHRHSEFRPQPYTQLAGVLRQMGHAGEARKVLMERTRLQAEATRRSRTVVPNGDVPVGFRSLWADCLNLGHWIVERIAFRVAGYGHAPVRSLWCLLGLFLAATALAQATWKEGSFAPNSAVILASPGWAKATAWDCFPRVDHPTVCDPNPAQTWANAFTASADQPTQGADWDSFNALGYGADLVVPFLDLGQTDAWAPSKDRGAWGWVLWWARWLLAALGWVVTGLGVAAVTGVMQRNQPD